MIRRLAAGLAIAAVAGCGGGHSAAQNGTTGDRIAHAVAVAMPTQVLGLTVKAEDVTKTVALAEHSYVDSVVLYGLRSDGLLQATFQISKFNPGSRYTSATFRQTIANQVGSQLPVTATVNGQTVYVTAGNRQRLSVWFRGSYLFILATRQDYAMPRTLLRQLLALDPGGS